jgi:predicted Holliday junction resolvase-like endonuclease
VAGFFKHFPKNDMSDVSVGFLILIIIVIVLFVKWSSLREQLSTRASQEARAMFETWKAAQLKRELAREVELSIAAIKEKAENEVRLAKQEARFEFQKWKADETLRIRQDSSARSSAVHVGKVTEHLIPWFLDGAFDPRDIRFLGSPIDLVVFHGLSAGYIEAIHFIEVKSGKRPILAPREELVRGAVIAGRIAYSIVHLAPDGESGGANLNWLGEKPKSHLSKIMNEEMRMLLERRSEAVSEMEFDTVGEIDEIIFENFGRSIANLADEVAMLREEVRSGKTPPPQKK